MTTLQVVIAIFVLFLFIVIYSDNVDEFKRAQIMEYYLCMSRREKGIVENSRVNPNPLVVEVDTIAVMPCIDCRNPTKSREYFASKKYKWFYRLWQPDTVKEEVPVDSSRNIKTGYYVDKTYHTLIAFGVNNLQFSGEYYCEDEWGTVISSYDLDVVPQDNVKIVLPGEEWDNPSEPLKEPGLEVTTEWTMWTGCNRCGAVAERRRYGKCIVKRNKEMELQTVDLIELFRRYPTGVPCRFSWLPLAVQTEDFVLNRPNYIQSELCKFYCVTEPPLRYITERTKDGEGYRVIEKVKNNRYSVREVLPRLPPPVMRIIKDTKAGDGLALYCPIFEGEIFWKKGDSKENTVILTSITLHELTDDRIFVDGNRNLVFDHLEGEDKGIFSCWGSEGILLMTATINVTEPAKDALIKTGLILAGITIVFLTAFYILWSSFKMKK